MNLETKVLFVRFRGVLVGGFHLLYSVEETASNVYVVTVCHSDPYLMCKTILTLA